MERRAYPTDLSDEEWAFVAPYLTLMTEEAPQREHSLREVFDGRRWRVRPGAAWGMRPCGFAGAYGGASPYGGRPAFRTGVGNPPKSAVSPDDLLPWAAVYQQSQR